MTQLLKSEKIYLKDNFRIVDYTEEPSVRINQLLDEEFLLQYLHDIKAEFNTDSIFVAGSQLMKRLGFNISLPPLYLMTVHNMKLDMDFDCARVVPNKVGEVWIPNLYFEEFNVIKMDDIERQEQRKTFIVDLLAKIDALINVLSKVSRVPKPNLWENTAIYIYWLYEKKLKDEQFKGIEGRVEDDYEFLIRGLSAEVSDKSCNQLTNFYWGRRIEDDGTRIRRTCCFHYGANSERKRCGTCPKSPNDVAKPLPFETVKN